MKPMYKIKRKEFYRRRASWFTRILLEVPAIVYDPTDSLQQCRENLNFISDKINSSQFFARRRKLRLKTDETSVSIVNLVGFTFIRFSIEKIDNVR